MKPLPALVLAAVLLAGCATPGPHVNLVNVRFTEATAFETTALFTLRLINESPKAMQLDGGAHKIYVNGLYVGEGLNGDSVDLPRLGSATQDVMVHLDNIRMATRIKPIIEGRSFDYRIKSVVYCKPASSRMHSESEGRLDLKDFQPSPAGASSLGNPRR